MADEEHHSTTTTNMLLDNPNDNNNVEHHPEYWRYHIPPDFYKIWTPMKDLGWKWRGGKRYQAPLRPDGTPGKVFDDAKAVLDYLNSFALPNVYTNLEWVDDRDRLSVVSDNNADDDPDPSKAQQDREIGLALRKDILARLYQKNRNALDNVDRIDDSMETDDEEKVSDDTSKPAREGNRRKSSRVASRTATALEQGADLYMRRRQRHAGGKNTKKGTVVSSSKRTEEHQQRLSVNECQAFIENQSMEQIEKMEEAYHSQFAKWRFLLSTNHSLLFYGAGSKRELLNSFATNELQKEGETLVIDGTDEEVTIDGILDVLVHVFLDGSESNDLSAVPPFPDSHVPVIGQFCPWRTNPTVERAIMVGRGFAHLVEGTEQTVPPTVLLIHSLDARIATPAAQEALAALVINSAVANGVAALRLVASVDHVDAPTFLWDTVTEANFSWFPCCVHTHRPYLQELNLIEEDNAYRKKTERASRTNTQAQRILDVLQGLAPRHTEIVQLLAQLQRNENTWVDYLQFRERCKSACAVNKDSQLRHLMKELMDHGLIAFKTEGSNEFVQIPFSAEKIEEIIDFERDG